MDRRNQLDTKIVYILLIILIFSVISFGAVEIWSLTIVEFSIFTVFIFYLIVIIQYKYANQNPEREQVKEEKYLLIVLLGFIAYILIQTLPMPAPFLRFISPKSYEIYSFYSVEKVPSMSISLYTYKTKFEFVRSLSYFVFLILIIQSIRNRMSLERMLKIMCYFGFALAVFAIIQKATWNGKIYWLRELTTGGTPFGPFVNRNHYAGLMGMLIPLSLGLALTRERFARKILFGFLGLIMAVSLFLSLSRAGIISFFAGVSIFTLFLFWNKLRRKKVLVIPVFLFILFLYLLYLGIDPVIDRFYQTDITKEARFKLWSETMSAFKDFYLTGSGMGTFIYLYPLYSKESFSTIYDHAHNDYIEFMLECGVIGILLFLLLLYFYIRILLKTDWDSKSGIINLSLLASVITIAVHSFFDFNLHIPSNALLLSAIIGISVANSRIISPSLKEED
ncbi:MAG: O-antigen ligase family protein [Nitrospirae bacterium]|nr:O-antigen ligase family protein [Nitrospirota bacterium]